MNEKQPPYTTSTGIKIGSRFERGQITPLDYDMELLQTALLTPRVIRPNFFVRLVNLVRNRMERTL